jgi:hypothetical protein
LLQNVLWYQHIYISIMTKLKLVLFALLGMALNCAIAGITVQVVPLPKPVAASIQVVYGSVTNAGTVTALPLHPSVAAPVAPTVSVAPIKYAFRMGEGDDIKTALNQFVRQYGWKIVWLVDPGKSSSDMTLDGATYEIVLTSVLNRLSLVADKYEEDRGYAIQKK